MAPLGLKTGAIIRPTALTIMAGGIFAAGCIGDAAQPRRRHIVASISVVADAVRMVGGERVEVHTLVGPGGDPHQYLLQPRDLEILSAADMVFIIGLGLEESMRQVLAEPNLSGRTVAVSGNIDRAELLPATSGGGAFDPHVWFDVRLWVTAIQTVADSLAKLDSASADFFLSNAASYQNQLLQLDEWMVARAREISEARRVLITAHRGFDYLGRRMGLETVGVLGTGTTAGVDPDEIDRVAAVVVARDIPFVFAETSLTREDVEAVRGRVGAQGGSVEIAGPLYSDATGNPETVEETYIGMMGYDVNAIVAALAESPILSP
ncbi:MAG: zinc ABC transporter solute-binding protein [Gemmatimonadales bacterium]|nr:zinc ABC transporter solute-binding protein [Gemmatimonadales bacterium]